MVNKVLQKGTLLHFWLSLGYGDLKNIGRDVTLLLTFCVPVLMTLLYVFGIPPLETFLLERFSFSLEDHRPLVVALMLTMTPLTLGMVTGFLLLDDRDEGLLRLFAVTPLGTSGYLGYRIFSPAGICFLFSCLIAGVAGGSTVSVLLHMPAFLLCSLSAVLMTLLMAAFAGNKVEGLAVGKAAGVLFLVPLVAYVTGPTWKWLLAWAPPFWAAEAIRAGTSDPLAYAGWMAGGLAVHAGYGILLFRKFRARL